MIVHVSYEDTVPFDFQGLLIRELTPERMESASVTEVEVAPGTRHQTARSTNSDKIYVCVEGTVFFRVSRQNVSLEPRDVLLVRKDEWFDYHNDTANTARLILVHVPPFDLASEEFRD